MFRSARILLSIALLLVLSQTQAQQAFNTYTSKVRESVGAVTLEQLNKHVRKSAEGYRAYGQILRIGFHNMAYPKDQTEYRMLAGHGVALITTITQKREELPITRVYFESGGRVIDLKRIKSKLTRVHRSEKLVRRTFGRYRMDGLYLFPVTISFQGVALKLDYSKNRKGLVIGRFPPKAENPYASDRSARGLSRPDLKVLEHFIEREFPGYQRIR